MKRKNIIKWIFVTGLFSCSIMSCSDWLEVDMEDSILENSLYSSNEGYTTALNGIYTSLNETSIYGDALSMGFVDIMAQYYNISDAVNHKLAYYSMFKFEQDDFKKTTSALWTKMYELIANINVLLEHCDAADAAILPRYYPFVKGEALALRAMLHFDLLRLFGPIYNEETATILCMPYQETSKKEIQPMLSSQDVLLKIIRDLEAADALLKDDPIITEGIKDGVASDDGLDSFDFSYRQLRLNHYAVKALLARAYLWQGNKEKTYSIVKKDIIDKIKTEKLDTFPWMDESAFSYTVNQNRADYLYSSEVIFGLYDMKRVNVYDSRFKSSVASDSRLYFVGKEVASDDSKLKSFYDDGNDIRKRMWSMEASGENSTNNICLKKYVDFSVSDSYTYRYLIPLIRLSEVYLMAAECSSSIEEAAGYINLIRNKRDCKTIVVNAENLEESIMKEFAREMIGEGQLFFYYKRLGKEKVISGTKAGEMSNMALTNYVMPLPEAEKNERQ